jgi:hypothetical protein
MNRESKLAYLAGVLDSDGWFTIHKSPISEQRTNHGYYPSVGINQCEKEAIELAQELYGGKITVVDYSKQQNRFSQRPMWHWQTHSSFTEKMLEELIPHLRIKVKQAQILLRLVKDIRVNRRGGKYNPHPKAVIDFRESLYQEIRKLNCRPVAETECVGSSNGDATVRSAQMENVQSTTEMFVPA